MRNSESENFGFRSCPRAADARHDGDMCRRRRRRRLCEMHDDVHTFALCIYLLSQYERSEITPSKTMGIVN